MSHRIVQADKQGRIIRQEGYHWRPKSPSQIKVGQKAWTLIHRNGEKFGTSDMLEIHQGQLKEFWYNDGLLHPKQKRLEIAK